MLDDLHGFEGPPQEILEFLARILPHVELAGQSARPECGIRCGHEHDTSGLQDAVKFGHDLRIIGNVLDRLDRDDGKEGAAVQGIETRGVHEPVAQGGIVGSISLRRISDRLLVEVDPHDLAPELVL